MDALIVHVTEQVPGELLSRTFQPLKVVCSVDNTGRSKETTILVMQLCFLKMDCLEISFKH